MNGCLEENLNADSLLDLNLDADAVVSGCVTTQKLFNPTQYLFSHCERETKICHKVIEIKNEQRVCKMLIPLLE